jgi:hypothetical protein
MKKKIFVLLVVSLLSLLFTIQALAEPPSVVDFTYTLVDYEDRGGWVKGKNQFFVQWMKMHFEDSGGRIDLTRTIEVTGVAHPNGVITWQGWSTYEGTIDGLEGTLYARTVGQSMFGEPIEVIHAHCTILSGTGELENMRGTFTGSGTVVSGTGTARYHLAP